MTPFVYKWGMRKYKALNCLMNYLEKGFLYKTSVPHYNFPVGGSILISCDFSEALINTFDYTVIDL